MWVKPSVSRRQRKPSESNWYQSETGLIKMRQRWQDEPRKEGGSMSVLRQYGRHKVTELRQGGSMSSNTGWQCEWQSELR